MQISLYQQHKKEGKWGEESREDPKGVGQKEELPKERLKYSRGDEDSSDGFPPEMMCEREEKMKRRGQALMDPSKQELESDKWEPPEG